jgi:hypothetical protein
MIRKLTCGSSERIETGALQFYDDWPGMFIRGDDCIWLKLILEKIQKKEELSIIDYAFLRGIHSGLLEVLGVEE